LERFIYQIFLNEGKMNFEYVVLTISHSCSPSSDCIDVHSFLLVPKFLAEPSANHLKESSNKAPRELGIWVSEQKDSAQDFYLEPAMRLSWASAGLLDILNYAPRFNWIKIAGAAWRVEEGGVGLCEQPHRPLESI
jgi:hypothetical protein